VQFSSPLAVSTALGFGLVLFKGVNMKKALIGAWLAVTASMVWATCTTNTVTYNGRIVTCTTCCFNGNCTTNCF
jgi:hypothetical protein